MKRYGTLNLALILFRVCYQVLINACIATPLWQSKPELSSKDEAGFGRREKLLRQLSSLENGPLAELEKANTERKHLLEKATIVLDKLVSTAAATRLEMERRDQAAAGSKDILEATRERVTQVRRGSGFARLSTRWTKIKEGGVIS